MNVFLKQDQDRLRQFKKLGYDIPKARNFVISKSGITGGSMLEVGTGKGNMAAALAKKGFKIISIDIDKKSQQAAKTKLKIMKLDKLVSLKIMDAEKLKYKDGSFDYVISVNFIHHATKPVKCLTEMARVTKRKLIVADLNKTGERIMDRIHGLNGHGHATSNISLKAVKLLLEKLGMTVKIYRDTCQTILVAKKGD